MVGNGIGIHSEEVLLYLGYRISSLSQHLGRKGLLSGQKSSAVGVHDPAVHSYNCPKSCRYLATSTSTMFNIEGNEDV